MNHHAVRAPVIDLEEPEGVTKVGIRFRYKAVYGTDTASPQVDRESIRALKRPSPTQQSNSV